MIVVNARKPVLFTKKIEREYPHAPYLNTKIRSNRRGKERKAKLLYTKANGDTVNRTVKPLSAKGNVLIAHDYERDAIRSFRIDRIRSMEKTAFFNGFEKKADWSGRALLGALVGGTAAALPFAIAADRASKKFEEKAEDEKNLVPFDKAVKQYKKHVPGVKFYSKSQLDQLASKEQKGFLADKDVATAASKVPVKGNAAFFRMPGIEGPSLESILLGDKVAPSAVAHEVGHVLSYRNMSKLPEEEQRKLIKTIAQEEDAWRRAPGKIDEELKQRALDTYYAGDRVGKAALVGSLLGGVAGAIIKGKKG